MTMMEISKFRRKAKKAQVPPALVTDTKALEPRDSSSSMDSASTIVTDAAGSVTNPPPQKPSGFRKSAFRSLHLRSATKRARSPAAAPAFQLASPSPATPAGRDKQGPVTPQEGRQGPPSPVSLRHRDGHAVGKMDSGNRKTKLPSFLKQSQDELDLKFCDLNWLDPARQTRPGPRDATGSTSSTPPLALYKSTDTSHGPMDRYCNIKPYARNRVRLQVPEGTLDYVNASNVTIKPNAIKRKLPSLRYIAMQGPIENSVDFVWRMVHEQIESPGVIIQLTPMFEGLQPKCFPYLPMSADDDPISLNEKDRWGDGWRAEVRFDSMETVEGGAIEIRKLILSVHPPAAPVASPSNDAPKSEETNGVAADDNEQPESKAAATEKILWHFLYTKWPDFGVPAAEDIDSFLTLIRLTREYNLGNTGSPNETDAAQVEDSPPAQPEAEPVTPENGNSLAVNQSSGSSSQEANPRIIHCSAGVGRTGTFITLEHVLRELEAGHLESYDSTFGPDRDLILETVESLREQRILMVQAIPQFHLLYQVLRRMWTDKYGPLMEEDDEPAAKRLEVNDPFVD